MSFDFDNEINREKTNSVKYDERQKIFGNSDVIPLWVADMDFATPSAITKALIERANHPIYGYTRFPESIYETTASWLKQRHNWTIEHEWIVMCPGVVPSLNAVVMAFTRPGDSVIVQPPVYFPFFNAVTDNRRKLIHNPLQLKNGRYTINFDHLEQCAKQAHLLLLCSPHNPVGRVWNVQELQHLLEISEKYGLIILADEIHADLIYPDNKHHMLAALNTKSANVITAVTPSKTFNIPGLNLSTLVIPDKKIRAAITQVFNTMHVSAANPFNITAFEAAYRDGKNWLEALMIYLRDTRDYVATYLVEHIPEIKLIKPEGTYLLWLDCRALNMTDSQLNHFFIHEAGIGMSPGAQFGKVEGSGFMRLNIGAPRKTILTALEKTRNAINKL
ncbi:MAG: pyridoxal phosphate-dependent aminotransferase [Nitrosomonas sp.]|nr:pyridoxal phosphate-dependent aminotransferase [Nitrosomonas sp.]